MKEFSAADFEALIKEWITSLIKFAPALIGAIALYFAGRYLINFIVKMVSKLMNKREVEPTLQTFLLQVIRWVLHIALFLTIVQVIGLPATQFIAIITSGFVAVGLALQGSLSNFASGIMILIFKPFRVGDVIEGKGQKGTVKNIGLFATTLNKPNNEQVIIPNTQLFSDSIINYSREEKRRVFILVGIGYGDNIQKAREVLLQIAKDQPLALSTPEPEVMVEELSESSVNLSLRYWCMSGDYAVCYFSSLEEVKNRFDAANINIPYPQVQINQ